MVVSQLRAPGGRGPWLEFWPQIQPKDGKNRLHLDVAPSAGGGVDTEVRRLVALGAEPVGIGQGDLPWVVLADPEGQRILRSHLAIARSGIGP